MRPLPAPGHMGVDYEQRVDFDRLRGYRLGRVSEALAGSECGALLLFDFYNIRYTTQTWVGGALGDKMTRYALLPDGGEPMLWDFGSATRHHQLYSPWLSARGLPPRHARHARCGGPQRGADGVRGDARSRACSPTPASPTSRSGSTSSSRRSCSRCSARVCTWSTASS